MSYYTNYIPAVLIPVLFQAACYGQVSYRVDFDVTWSADTHPGAYPIDAHFSPLIGTTHDDSVSFWEPGGIASDGIEQMAETGGTGGLAGEIAAATGRRTRITSSSIFGTGRRSAVFSAEPDESLITLVTMVAPSPDWFVGVSGLELRPGGMWTNSLTVDLFAWDAGTDSGADFNSDDFDTVPRTPIALLGEPLPNTAPPLGTFTFTLLTVPEPSSWLLGVSCCLAGMGRRTRAF
ncbi:MAG: spondin domain-containing protein [Planctomycetota bacterium]